MDQHTDIEFLSVFFGRTLMEISRYYIPGNQGFRKPEIQRFGAGVESGMGRIRQLILNFL